MINVRPRLNLSPALVRGAVATRLHSARDVFHNFTYAWPLPLDASAVCLVETGDVSSHFSGVYAPPPAPPSGDQATSAPPTERYVTELRSGEMMLVRTATPAVAKQWGGNRNIPLALLVGGVAWLGWTEEEARGALATLQRLQKDIPSQPSCLLELSVLALLQAVRVFLCCLSICMYMCLCSCMC